MDFEIEIMTQAERSYCHGKRCGGQYDGLS